MAYGVWGGGGEEDRELEYRESEDDEVGRIFYYGLGGGAAGAGGRISWRERRWGKTAQNSEFTQTTSCLGQLRRRSLVLHFIRDKQL